MHKHVPKKGIPERAKRARSISFWPVLMHKHVAKKGIPERLDDIEDRLALLMWRLDALVASFKANDLLSRVVKLENDKK